METTTISEFIKKIIRIVRHHFGFEKKIFLDTNFVYRSKLSMYFKCMTYFYVIILNNGRRRDFVGIRL